MKRTRKLNRAAIIIFTVCIAADVIESAAGIGLPVYDTAQYWTSLLGAVLLAAGWYFIGRRDESKRHDGAIIRLIREIRKANEKRTRAEADR